MLRRIHFHGPLRAASATPIEIHGDTVAECLEGVSRQLDYFKPDVNGMKRLQVEGFDTEASLHVKLGDQADIHVTPAISFGKDGGLMQVVVGVVLIVVGVAMGGVFWPAMVINMGVTLVLGGVMQMLAPAPPRLGGAEDDERTRYLGAPQNTTGIGTTLPVLVGEYLVQGHFLAFDIDAADGGL